MKKHMVLGCYRFVGYHLCDFLLETGDEVIGVDWKSDMVEDEREEKALSFGRNANFTFHSIDDEFEVKAEWVIHIPYYDFGNIQNDILIKINDIVEESRLEGCLVIELYPYGVQLVDEAGKIRLISPTIYGPWQPSGELIQSLLTNEAISSPGNGMVNDALYVRDLVEEWPNILELKSDVYELVSDLDYHLKSCLELANNKEEIILQEKRNIKHKKYEIKVKTKPEEGIYKQKKHMELQKKLQEWKKK
ncbi:NAD(P)-dependent oxidoreductase [Peribacillus alkalitolerans]|uniref:NAD(P)-dependent oxidoreductase n=1 Tax=Peribacillus alkalitolerans TaxID=1550385 RepID=UPI0013D84872|nr:NAD(P)-dependent oxidoreductase [Peribacillus alkalitolerans]